MGLVFSVPVTRDPCFRGTSRAIPVFPLFFYGVTCLNVTRIGSKSLQHSLRQHTDIPRQISFMHANMNNI